MFLHFFTDIVFFIFLYQRWIYKVDKSRVNEFGYSGEMEEAKKKVANGNATEPAGAIEAKPSSPSAAKTKSKKDKKRD